MSNQQFNTTSSSQFPPSLQFYTNNITHPPYQIPLQNSISQSIPSNYHLNSSILLHSYTDNQYLSQSQSQQSQQHHQQIYAYQCQQNDQELNDKQPKTPNFLSIQDSQKLNESKRLTVLLKDKNQVYHDQQCDIKFNEGSSYSSTCSPLINQFSPSSIVIDHDDDDLLNEQLDNNSNTEEESTSNKEQNSTNSEQIISNSEESTSNKEQNISDIQDILKQNLQRKNSAQCSTLSLKKKRISKEDKQNILRYKQSPQYRILPIDYDDLPINEFHLYSDILISLQDLKIEQDSSRNAAIVRNQRQINFICQWKYINQMEDTKRELRLFLSNKTETKKDFDTIIKLLKVRNQSQELGRLLIEAESRLKQIQNTIRESFDLMRKNGLMQLYYERRNLFERKCEFFLKEVSPQKKYIYVKSYYNDEKCEIEDSEMGVSSKLVELLSYSEVGLMIYKLMRGNYPEIFGSKLKELFSKQSVVRMLSFEQNSYNECIFDNMELTTMDGFIFPASMTVKRIQFKYDPIYANLPLQDKFLYIEFNINPKVIQQINKLRRELSIPFNNIKEQHPQTTPQIIQQSPQQKCQSPHQKCQSLHQKCQSEEEQSMNLRQLNESNIVDEKEEQQSECSCQYDNKANILIEEIEHSKKQSCDLMNANNRNRKKENVFSAIKTRKKKDRGFVEENEKDFYYEMQSQVFLDKFYDYIEIQELIKQSELDQQPTLIEDTTLKSNSSKIISA